MSANAVSYVRGIIPDKANRERDLARLLDKVTPEPNSGCWLWTAAAHRLGYGIFKLDGRVVGAHQAAYALLVGPVPEGAELDHKCRVRCCCNPDHLEPVTHAENCARGHHATKARCKHGHALTAENVWRSGDGRRHCRECKNARNRALRARKRGRLG